MSFTYVCVVSHAPIVVHGRSRQAPAPSLRGWCAWRVCRRMATYCGEATRRGTAATTMPPGRRRRCIGSPTVQLSMSPNWTTGSITILWNSGRPEPLIDIAPHLREATRICATKPPLCLSIWTRGCIVSQTATHGADVLRCAEIRRVGSAAQLRSPKAGRRPPVAAGVHGRSDPGTRCRQPSSCCTAAARRRLPSPSTRLRRADFQPEVPPFNATCGADA